jgi:DNA-binding NtrC family response regulator
MMPEMDGNQVLEALWRDSRTKTIPVIMLTNAGNIKNMDHAKFFSAFKFMVKVNVAPDEVIASVKEGLEVDKKIRETLVNLPAQTPATPS